MAVLYKAQGLNTVLIETKAVTKTKAKTRPDRGLSVKIWPLQKSLGPHLTSESPDAQT